MAVIMRMAVLLMSMIQLDHTVAFYSSGVSLRQSHARIVYAAKDDEEKRDPKITMQGLFELVSLGLGAPNLGTFKGVDKETGTLNFELESNRFIAKNGKEYNSFDNSKATYFEYGQVDESADVMAGFRNLFGKKSDKDDASSDSSSSSSKK